MQLWVVFVLGLVVGLITAFTEHERDAARVVLMAFTGGIGAWAGMAAARFVWLYGPPSAVGIFAAAVVGAVVVLAVERLALAPERVA